MSAGRAFRRINAGHAIPLLAVLLEVLWVYPWFVWIGGWQAVGWPRPPLGLASTVLLATTVEVVSRFTLGRSWSLRIVRPGVLAVALALVALVVRLEQGAGYGLFDLDWGTYASRHLSPIVGGLAFGVYLVWRGLAIGREDLRFQEVYHKFLVGLTGLVVLLVFWGATSRFSEFGRALSSVGGYVVAYFAVGLLALALTNLRALRGEMLEAGGESGLLGRRWLSLVAGVIVAIIVVGVVIASVFSFDLARLLLRPLNVLANWLLIAFLYGVALPLGVVAAGLVYALRWLAHLVGRSQPPQTPPSPSLGDLRDLQQGKEVAGFPPAAALALKWGLVALVVALVLFVLARTLLRYRRSNQGDEIEEVHESLFSWQAFMVDLRSWLAGLIRLFSRRKPAAPAELAPPLAATVAGADTRTFTVREIYQGLLWEGRQAGVPRRRPETPYEYLAKLASRLDVEVPELRAITEAYVVERYGEAETPAEELRLLNRLWRRLRSVLRGEDAPGGRL